MYSHNRASVVNVAMSLNATALINTAAPSTIRLSAYCVAHRAKVNMLRAKLMNFSDNSKPRRE